MKIASLAVKMMSNASAVTAYIIGTFLMAFGWLCALVQGDAPQHQPRIAGIVIIFAAAAVLLSVPTMHLWRSRRMLKILLMVVVGSQTLFCLYVIALEFTL